MRGQADHSRRLMSGGVSVIRETEAVCAASDCG
jgi:hypothetical protein